MSDSGESTDFNGYLFRDILTICLAIFVGFVGILLIQIKDAATVSAEIASPGSIMAMITWPEGNTDVDLWVDGPGEPTPIGYSNKGGVMWNLLRDDLGLMPDYTPLNFETAFTRGMPAGNYRVNVQCFRCPTMPVVVTLEVSLKDTLTSSVTMLASSTVTLNRDHEEKTGLAFALDADGAVVPDSMNTLFKPLRAAGGK